MLQFNLDGTLYICDGLCRNGYVNVTRSVLNTEYSFSIKMLQTCSYAHR